MEEQELILGEMSGQGKNLFQFALWSGLRTSEMVALDRSDIDWRHRVVIVNKAKTQGSKKIDGTKTKSSTREVKLLEPAYQALTAQKSHTFLAGKEVFQNPKTQERWAGDKPIRQSLWTSTVKRAGVIGTRIRRGILTHP